jgi:catechol 2,3-dioxygenase-like lactoylglutathione lyase family enzyme
MPTPAPNFFLLYVSSPPASARFYENLLGRPPVEASPTFALFALDAGLMLGLWSREAVQPAPPEGSMPGVCELGFPVKNAGAVDDLHRAWMALGLSLLQSPTRMDFGYTFTAADPDGHRLRVFAPEGQ